MTTYPLSTLGPTISSTGITAPGYADIYASLQASFKSIYGSDSYIDPDSQDGQMLGIFAQAQANSNAAAISVYMSFSPATAQGAALSSNVKINGLKRLVPSNSTADITIVGQAGTIISNGIVGDGTYLWALPASVTIPGGGSIVETATCTTTGAITAAANSINQIFNPTNGWQTANNAGAAVPGAPVEDDPELRVRQSVSTQLPAQGIIGGIYGTLANLTGVTQLKIYENDTSSPDANSIPDHSISVVIEGGDAVAIAQAIEKKKAPGTGTYGTTSEVVTDPVGIPVTINFFRPTQVTILVDITIHALAGYVSTTGTQIVANIVNFINALGIAANNGLLSLTSLYAPALDTGLSNTYNITSLTIAISPASPGSSDLTIAFNALPICTTSNVILTVT